MLMKFAKGSKCAIFPDPKDWSGPAPAAVDAHEIVFLQITPTSGDVHVTGCNMHRETLKALESMGSCPQIDTLWEDVTTSEHLELFGILNGLRPETRKRTVKT